MKKTMIFALLLSVNGFAGPAILLDEGKPGKVFTSPSSVSSSSSGPSRSLFQSESTMDAAEFSYPSYEDALAMRAKRRVGVGVVTAGQVGLAGAMIELNFTPQNSAIVQYGGGPKYNAVGFQWKHNFGGDIFTPYMSMGFSRWFNASGDTGPIGSTTPGILGEKYLTPQEKETGRFNKNFLIPSFGLEYHQLQGKYVGTGFFVEVVLLMEVAKLSPSPTGALGLLYYF